MQVGIFVITFFFSWLAIELITQWRYPRMSTNKKTAMIVVVGLLQFYFIACSSNDKVEEVKSPEAKIIRDDGYRKQALADFAELVAAPQPVEQVIEEEEWIINKEKIIAIKYPDDAFSSFRCCFFAARKELGPGKHFIWKNQIYTTMWKNEVVVN